MPYLILHNVVLPITAQANDIAWMDALDYYPAYLRYGGTYTWGAYVSWLLKEAGVEGFRDLFSLFGAKAFLSRYEPMVNLAPRTNAPPCPHSGRGRAQN